MWFWLFKIIELIAYMNARANVPIRKFHIHEIQNEIQDKFIV